MQNNLQYLLHRKFLLLVLVLFVLVTAADYLKIFEPVDQQIQKIHYKIRGERDISDRFLFVYLGPEDAGALGGWPITRDYYGYFIHQAKEMNASVIALDIFFDRAHAQYTEYDDILSHFLENTPSVCLPFAFAHAPNETDINSWRVLQPLEKFRRYSSGLGFSNLESGASGHFERIAIQIADSLRLSFGAEIARLYLNAPAATLNSNHEFQFSETDNSDKIKLNRNLQLEINYFGGLNSMQSMSFLDFIQLAEQPEHTLDLENRIVVLGITIPGITMLENTPFSGDFPATLVHANIAENIINQNYFQNIPGWLAFLLLLISIAAAVLLPACFSGLKQGLCFIIGLILVLLFSQYFFAYRYFLLPNFAIFLLYTAGFFVSNITQVIFRKREAQHQRQQLQETLEIKDGEMSRIESDVREKSAKLEALEAEVSDLKIDETAIEQKIELHSEFLTFHPESPFAQVVQVLDKISDSPIPVLIEGETGTGKEVVARSIHRKSRLCEKPFIAVNCGALSESLLESELFGHEKGAFTGATNRRCGRFELADGGTIFLDEITETSPVFQAKLLRVLQEGVFERVGGETTISVSVRIIAASNRELEKSVAAGEFRSDLFYRLNGFLLKLPALHQRKTDIPLLVAEFLEKYASVKLKISEGAMNCLKNYPWPGNIRELENTVRRAILLVENEQKKMIQKEHLPENICGSKSAQQVSHPSIKSLEEQILISLREYAFSRSAISQTAERLGKKDRGTITEYFRGICFQYLARNNFDKTETIQQICNSKDPETQKRVSKKIEGYLQNLLPLPENIANMQIADAQRLKSFRGLPKKFHSYLFSTMKWMSKEH